ncbi:PepSY domain-containing protein [Niallia nealsonii]|nr:PepSY domain-containing protein [Niallia nealsonii]
MKRIGKIGVFVIIGVILLIVSYFFMKKQDRITLKEAETIIIKKYDGEIVSIEEIKKERQLRYDAVLQNEKGIYNISVDAQTGAIADLQAAKISQQKEDKELTKEEAVKLVTATYKGTLKSTTAQTENGIAYFVVILEADNKEMTYKINRQTGSIKQESKNSIEETAIIKKNKAKEIAQAEVQGSVKEVELEEEANQLVYEVEMETAEKTEVKIYINAYSGTVLSINWEDD